jgi:hypothetical protein
LALLTIGIITWRTIISVKLFLVLRFPLIYRDTCIPYFRFRYLLTKLYGPLSDCLLLRFAYVLPTFLALRWLVNVLDSKLPSVLLQLFLLAFRFFPIFASYICTKTTKFDLLLCLNEILVVFDCIWFVYAASRGSASRLLRIRIIIIGCYSITNTP